MPRVQRPNASVAAACDLTRRLATQAHAVPSCGPAQTGEEACKRDTDAIPRRPCIAARLVMDLASER